MRGAAAFIACAAALAWPALASADDAPYVDWNPLLPGFPSTWQESKEKDCADGSNTCIERTLAEMYRRFDRLYPSCDHNSVFALVYTRVTEEIRKAVLRGHYSEPAFLNHEDAVFARMYFQAYDRWASGEIATVPPAWREAFGAARERSVNGIGNLLMSMNAHVNRDMPFMLANLGLVKPDGTSRKPDHDRGNQILATMYDDIFQEIATRWDPTIMNYDFPAGPYDNTTTFQILQGWREQVWRHAEMLVAASTPEQKKAVGDYIERYALGIAQQIKQNTLADSAARDAHCAAYQRKHRERGGLAEVVVGRRKLLRASRRGVVRVRLRCPAGIRTCEGQLVLERLRGRQSRRRAVAAARLRRPLRLAEKPIATIAPGGRAVVRVRLARKARRALRRTGRFRVRGRVNTTTAWGLKVSSRRRARLRLRR